MDEKKQEIKIHFPQDFKGGNYSNNMMVTHTKDEFIMDFIMLAHPVGIVNSRVITSPSQAKRIVQAMNENISKYENKFGKIELQNVETGPVNYEPVIKQ